MSDIGKLEVVSACVVYPNSGKRALDMASIMVHRGEAIAIVGLNGAGKTTLVNSMLGTVDLSAGTVLIDGCDAGDMLLAERIGHFGLLTQEFGRYELSIRDAVSLGVPASILVSDDNIWRALEVARLDKFVAGINGKLAAQIGDQFGGAGLSGANGSAWPLLVLSCAMQVFGSWANQPLPWTPKPSVRSSVSSWRPGRGV